MSRVQFPGGQGIFLYSTASISSLGPTKFSNQWVPGAHSPGINRPGREADQCPTSNAEVKNGGPTPHICLQEMVLNY
jgi:hypothetical protein